MKNVLHLCKCNVQGGAEYSSQVIYDGGSVDCIPGLVGENLSVVLERIGEFVCGLGIQVITTNEFEPSNEFGKDGDIHIREQEESIDLYQKLNGEWALVGSFPIGGGGGGVGDFVTINTDQFGLTGTKEWLGRHYFENTLAIPRAAPVDPDPTKAYIYVGAGSGALPPETFGNLEDLQNVASPIPVNKFLYKGSDGIWVGVDVPGQDLSAYAPKVWVSDNFYSKEISDGLFVTQATDQFDMPGNKGWTGRHHFDGSLAIPQAAPIAPDPTKAYIYVGEGSGATPPSGMGNLEDLQNVADTIANNKFLYKGSDGIWVGVDVPISQLYQPAIGQVGIIGGNIINLNTVNTSGNQTGIAGNKTTTGVWTFSNLSGTGDGIVGVNAGGTLTRRPESDVIQTLSLGTPAGNIAISGGNSVSLSSLARIFMATGISNLGSWVAGFHTYAYTTGASGFPATAGGGFMNKRSAGNLQGSFLIDKTNNNDGVLRYAVGSTSGLEDWEIFAAQSWTLNYVNSFGLGSLSYNQGWLYTSLNDIAAGNSLATSFIATNISSPPGTLTGFTYPFGIHVNATAAIRGDIVLSSASNRMAFRSGGRNLTEVWTTDNFNPSDFSAGMILENFRDPSFVYGQNNITAYPNATGTVISRIVDSTSPTGMAIRYTATGWAQANVRITFAGMPTQSAAGKVFIVKMIAKIPVGWEINDQHNATGSGTTRTWLTPKLGTGEYEEYIFKLVCGNTGTFSSANFFDLRKSEAATPNPSAGNPVVSYLAFATVIDTTESFINTRFRIPTTAPAYPLPGDVWVM